VQDTLAKVMRFVDAAAIAVVPLDNDALDHVADAAQRYGKGRGHPAQLNLCDCLAYGAARAGDASLLFVGQDFARTDIARTDIAPA
jgi:ribonuclease VapC